MFNGIQSISNDSVLTPSRTGSPYWSKFGCVGVSGASYCQEDQGKCGSEQGVQT